MEGIKGVFVRGRERGEELTTGKEMNGEEEWWWGPQSSHLSTPRTLPPGVLAVGQSILPPGPVAVGPLPRQRQLTAVSRRPGTYRQGQWR